MKATERTTVNEWNEGAESPDQQSAIFWPKFDPESDPATIPDPQIITAESDTYAADASPNGKASE